MAKTTWRDLSPAARKVLLVSGAVDAGLRLYALRDLRTRDAADLRGSRGAWGAALAIVSSAGILPLAYLLRGRRPR
jgi:hypothetical protein